MCVCCQDVGVRSWRQRPAAAAVFRQHEPFCHRRGRHRRHVERNPLPTRFVHTPHHIATTVPLAYELPHIRTVCVCVLSYRWRRPRRRLRSGLTVSTCMLWAEQTSRWGVHSLSNGRCPFLPVLFFKKNKTCQHSTSISYFFSHQQVKTHIGSPRSLLSMSFLHSRKSLMRSLHSQQGSPIWLKGSVDLSWGFCSNLTCHHSLLYFYFAYESIVNKKDILVSNQVRDSHLNLPCLFETNTRLCFRLASG